jgi:hypothetical protein
VVAIDNEVLIGVLKLGGGFFGKVRKRNQSRTFNAADSPLVFLPAINEPHSRIGLI